MHRVALTVELKVLYSAVVMVVYLVVCLVVYSVENLANMLADLLAAGWVDSTVEWMEYMTEYLKVD